MVSNFGQRVAVAPIRSGKVVVETAHLPRGMYLVTIQRDGKTASKKIILE